MDQTRELILDAAARRFAHYGYSKTTIAEIAADCAMSVGNVYRFFANKEAIAVAGVEQKMAEKTVGCVAVVDENASAHEQLARYLHQRLVMTHAMACNSPHFHELVELVMQRHGDLVARYEAQVQTTIEAILRRGIAQGEMREMNADASAVAIRLATFKFCAPTYMHQPLADLQAELDGVISLLYQGLKT